MMRLFVGLGLTVEARDALVRVVSGLGVRGRRTLATNYHLTLAFLGNRDEGQAPAIQPIIAAAAKDRRPLTLSVSKLGYFGKRESALLHAKLTESEALYALSYTLRQLLTEAGESFDPKPFAPHITLARKADLTVTDLTVPLPPITFTADCLTLFHSARIQDVLRYRPIFEAKFQE
jgi:RNA 2',3'-cyclic 3'-phosphodiesterase